VIMINGPAAHEKSTRKINADLVAVNAVNTEKGQQVKSVNLVESPYMNQADPAPSNLPQINKKVQRKSYLTTLRSRST